MQQHTNISVAATMPEGENVSEIQTLALRVQELNQSVDWWNTAMIWALVAAAMAAILVVATTYVVLTRAKQLADTQAEFIQAKHLKLARDLKSKDVKISELGSQAAGANARIAEAERGSAEARERATKAQASLALAEQHAAEANTKAEGFRLDIARANERAAESNKVAEQEHLARVRIEEKLAGWSMGAEAQARFIEKVRKFEGTPFDLGADPSEAGFMEVIDSILLAAKWKRQIPKSDNAVVSILLNGKARINFISGIFVEFAASRDKEFRPAASALLEAFRTEGIPAQGQVAISEPDESAIHIVIGRK